MIRKTSTILVVASLTWATSGCEDNPPGGDGAATPPSAAAPPSSVAAPEASASAAPAASASASAAEAPQPLDAPYDDWVAWTGFAPKCEFHVPTKKDELPRALAWKDCPAGSATGPCKALDVGERGLYVRKINTRRESGGELLAESTLNLGKETINVLFTADLASGRIRHAMASAANVHGCALDAAAVGSTITLAQITGTEPSEVADDTGFVPPGAFIAWTGEALSPQLVESWDAEITMPDVSLGARAWGRIPRHGVYVKAWGAKPEEFLLEHKATDQRSLLVVGEGALWIDGREAAHRLMVWKEGGAPAPVPAVEGARAFAGDDKDLAWLRKPKDAAETSCMLMTSPVGFEPSAIVPREVAKVPCEKADGWLDERFVVGCGYAAHSDRFGSNSPWSIYRLSDGQAWRVQHKVVGLTCKEAYVEPQDTAGSSPLFRIELAGLGPGTTLAP